LKTLIQFLVAALVLNACVHAGTSAWRYYEFKDAVEQEARFRGNEPIPKLKEHVLQLAAQEGIEVFPADVVIERQGVQTTISVAYLDTVELVPRFYVREHLFEFEVSVSPRHPLTP
jgi:hypothetical protein